MWESELQKTVGAARSRINQHVNLKSRDPKFSRTTRSGTQVVIPCKGMSSLRRSDPYPSLRDPNGVHYERLLSPKENMFYGVLHDPFWFILTISGPLFTFREQSRQLSRPLRWVVQTNESTLDECHDHSTLSRVSHTRYTSSMSDQ